MTKRIFFDVFFDQCRGEDGEELHGAEKVEFLMDYCIGSDALQAPEMFPLTWLDDSDARASAILVM